MTLAFSIRINCHVPTLDNVHAMQFAQQSLKYWHEKGKGISKNGHEQCLEFTRQGVITHTKQTKTGVSISIYSVQDN